MVLGNRFRARIKAGAMPWLHRYIGNPILSGMLNLLFGSGVGDAHCGLRAMRRDALASLQLQATGMEFASEMVIKAGKRQLRIEEIPIDYRPRIGESKLSRFRDAWRHVRFMLVHSPTFLFVIPGALAAVVGLGLLVYLAADSSLGERATGVAMASGALTIIGAQVVMLGLFARTYGVLYLGESDERLESAWQRLRLEHGLLASFVVLVSGVAVTVVSYFDHVHDPRLGMLGLTLIALGVQGGFASFFLSILGLSEHAVLRAALSPPLTASTIHERAVFVPRARARASRRRRLPARASRVGTATHSPRSSRGSRRRVGIDALATGADPRLRSTGHDPVRHAPSRVSSSTFSTCRAALLARRRSPVSSSDHLADRPLRRPALHGPVQARHGVDLRYAYCAAQWLGCRAGCAAR